MKIETYVWVLADLVQHIRVELSSESLEVAHVVDMFDAAERTLLVRAVTTACRDICQLVDPGRVVAGTDAALEDDKVRVGDDLCLG